MAPTDAQLKCTRCGCDLDGDGFCTAETCPFSDHQQTCMVGWSGHPDRDPFPNDDGVGPCTGCTCGGRLTCRECGETCFVTETGVSHHADADGDIDYDADADHVAVPEE